MTTSIRSRFAFSLGVNIVKAPLGFVAGLLVARGLGPDQYGKMVFLLATFTSLRQLLDFGSSTAFFTYISQRPRGRGFLAWFNAWIGLQFLVPLVALGIFFPTVWIELIWNGENRNLVVLAFIANYMQTTVWTTVAQIAESQRKTILYQAISLATILFHLLIVTVLWWQEQLSIPLVLAFIALEWLIATWLVAIRLNFFSKADQEESLKSILKEFGDYCLPLIPYLLLSMLYDFFDRWLLQAFSGSVQQAYYAVALQFSTIATIVASSIMNLLWREIAEAHDQGNHKRATMIYHRVSRGLFFVAAFIAGYLLPWSETILRLSLGYSYVGGTYALGIMLFYPAYQSLGQLGNVMLYATKRTRALSFFGIISMVTSLVITYLLLAPADAPISGFGLGSIGLAIKMVILQFVTVNVAAFYLALSMREKFDWLYQPQSILFCLCSGLFAYTISNSVSVISGNVWAGLTIAAILHSLLLLALIWLMPSIAGLDRSDFQKIICNLLGTKISHGAE